MIEQGIYFALGCIVTALCALMFAPVFWNRALRLTRQRLQLQIPYSMQEIYAERDQIRAEFAVERLRLEQELERVQAGKAGHMAEIGRRSMEVTRLAEQLATAKTAEQALDTTIVDLRQTLIDRDADVARLGLGLREAHEHASRLEAATAARTDSTHTDPDQPDGPDEVGRELAALKGALSETLEREKSVHLQNSLRAERGRSADRASAGRIEQLEAENAALRDDLQAALQQSSKDFAADDDGLRKSIHDLGLAVAAMSVAAKRSAAVDQEAEARSIG